MQAAVSEHIPCAFSMIFSVDFIHRKDLCNLDLRTLSI